MYYNKSRSLVNPALLARIFSTVALAQSAAVRVATESARSVAVDLDRRPSKRQLAIRSQGLNQRLRPACGPDSINAKSIFVRKLRTAVHRTGDYGPPSKWLQAMKLAGNPDVAEWMQYSLDYNSKLVAGQAQNFSLHVSQSATE